MLANIISSLAIFNNPNYVPERWHVSLIMIATMVVPFVFNLWFRKLIDAFEITGGILHICLFIVFIIVLVVFGQRNDADFVFNTLIWEASGWENKGVSFSLGMLSAIFALTGADSVLHMSKPAISSIRHNQELTYFKVTRSRKSAHACPAALPPHALSTQSC